jgi:hypothetical protein
MFEFRHQRFPQRIGAFFLAAFFLGGAKSTLFADTSTEEIRIHALAFGAILDSLNGDPHSQLALPLGPAETQDREQKKRQLLASAWGINSREDLLNTLAGLQSGERGSRRAFWETRHKLLEGKMENYIRIISDPSADNNGASTLIVATHLSPIRGSALPISAWDFGRYINLCRWGFVCGWLTEQESWDRIIPAARLLQSSYTSWDEFASDYLLGRNFWNPESGSDNETIRYTIALLKLPPKGLWSTIPWSQPLGPGEALGDTLAAKALDHYVDPDPNGVSMDHLPNIDPVIIAHRTSIDSK